MKNAYMITYNDAVAELIGKSSGVWIRNEDEASAFIGSMGEDNTFAIVNANDEVLLIADTLPAGVQLAEGERQTWAYLVDSVSSVIGDCTSATEVEFERIRVNSGVCVAGDWFLTISGLLYGTEILFRQALDKGGQVWPHREARPVYAKQRRHIDGKLDVIDEEQLERMHTMEEAASFLTLVEPVYFIEASTTA